MMSSVELLLVSNYTCEVLVHSYNRTRLMFINIIIFISLKAV